MIQTYDVRQTAVHSDASEGYEITCPECKGKVVVAEHAWWDTTCDCGYRWDVIVVAIGEKRAEARAASLSAAGLHPVTLAEARAVTLLAAEEVAQRRQAERQLEADFWAKLEEEKENNVRVIQETATRDSSQ